MSVQLEAIKFNHNPNSATGDALNIRRNASSFVPVPEWTRGIWIKPEDSPAAYAIQETKGHTITVQVQLKRIDPRIASAEVRALDADIAPPAPGGCSWLIQFLQAVLWALFGNALGEVAARPVV